MRSLRFLLIGITLTGLAASTASAQEPVKIGLITTLSGPAGYLGADVRDGFLLAAEMESGKLGGVPVQVLVEDDGFKPGQGKQIADKFLKSENIKLLTGIIFSNIVGATVPDILDADAIYVSPNAATVEFLRQGLQQKLLVSCRWQNDRCTKAPARTPPIWVTKRRLFLPRIPGRQGCSESASNATSRARSSAKSILRLDQTDYAPEMARIRAAKPDVVFPVPSRRSRHFLHAPIPAGPSAWRDPDVVAAHRWTRLSSKRSAMPPLASTSAPIGTYDLTTTPTKISWLHGRRNMARTHSERSTQPGLRHRACHWRGSSEVSTAISSDTDAFRAAMLKADFHSVRGAFKFGDHPASDPGLVRSARGKEARTASRCSRPSARSCRTHGDAYAKDEALRALASLR